MKVVGWLLVVGIVVLAAWFFGYRFPHRSPGPRMVSASGGFSLCIPNDWTPKEQPDGSILAQSPAEAAQTGGSGTDWTGASLVAFTVTELQAAALQTLRGSIARMRSQYSLVSLSLAQLPDPRMAVFLAMELPPSDMSEWNEWPRGDGPGTGVRVDSLRLFQSVPITLPAASGRLVIFQMQGPAGIEAHRVAVMEKSNRLTIVNLQTHQKSMEAHRRMADRILRSFRWVH